MISLRVGKTEFVRLHSLVRLTAAGAASFVDDERFKTQMLKSDLILQPGSAVLTCVFLQKSAFCGNLGEYLFINKMMKNLICKITN